MALLISMLSIGMSASALDTSQMTIDVEGQSIPFSTIRQMEGSSKVIYSNTEETENEIIVTTVTAIKPEISLFGNSGTITIVTKKDVTEKNNQSTSTSWLFAVEIVSKFSFNEAQNYINCIESGPITTTNSSSPSYINVSPSSTITYGSTITGKKYVKCSVNYSYRTDFGMSGSGSVWHQMHSDGSLKSSN